MFKKILIANRGEITCRIISTARKMGIRTIAVYSDADQNAKHVRMADEAVHIGPPPSEKSYLQIDAIVKAAKQSGAEAIHPGYGFLSENPDFVEEIEEAGLAFIGPSARSVRAMGLKDAAKALMETANVPVVPGYHGGEQAPDKLKSEAERIGFPLLIKARAGGGGKGMRKVERPEDFAAALQAAASEAQSSFGDGGLILEKYIECPRHIEVQIFGDKHGEIVHLFERDCTIQRRHQKLIEEAPAPGMSPNMREAMTRAAINAARAVDYYGAGTVEFIVDSSKGLCEDGFWFMEMNTRLQVEHPVSEAITGLDFVELQLRIAAGEPLGFSQSDVTLEGHAIEARICAEDPGRDFLPEIGRIEYLECPAESEFAPSPNRLDCGFDQGEEISPHYDPMIGKLIAHGPDREQAIKRAKSLIAKTHIAPLRTNLEFLFCLLDDEDFTNGKMTTGLIEQKYEALTVPSKASENDIKSAAALLLGMGPADPDFRHFRNFGEAEYFADLKHYGRVSFGPEVDLSPPHWRDDIRLALWRDHHRFDFALEEHHAQKDDADDADAIYAPMHGLLRRLEVRIDQKVLKDEPLIILEAMKMEHVLGAPRDGIIAEICAEEGAQIAEGELLIRLKSGDGQGPRS